MAAAKLIPSSAQHIDYNATSKRNTYGVSQSYKDEEMKGDHKRI